MRHTLSALAAAAAVAIAAPASAQSYSSSSSAGFYYNGFVGMDYISSGGSNGTGTMVDMTFGVRPGGTGSLGGIGFEFGFWGIHQNFGGSGSEMTAFAALTFGLGGGVLHVGAPRSAVHGIVDTPVPTGARAALFEFGLLTGAVPFSTLIAVSADRPVLGAMYEREAGPLRYAASYGQLRDGGTTANVLGLGVEREIGGTRLFGTLERLWTSADAITTATIGGSTMIGGGATGSLRAIEVGGNLTYLDQGGSSVTTATLYSTASLTDRLDVTASLLHLRSGGSSQSIYGLNATYDVWNGVNVNAGVGRQTGGGDTIWTVGLFRDF